MLYHVRLKGEPEGPWPLRDIVMMSGVTLETLVCPEFDLGAWRPIEAVVGKGSETAFLFQIRMRAEQLLRSNQKLRWELQQRAEDHAKMLEEEKTRSAQALFELEQRKQQLDEVLDHNLELDTATDENRQRLESAERRLEEARRDFDRVDAERKAIKLRAQSLERELEEIRRLSSDAESSRTQIETLRADFEAAQRELIRGRAIKEARDRQFDEMRAELDNAKRKAIEIEARLRTQSFENETLSGERAKELELFKLKAERAETSLEEKRKTVEEMRMRMEAVEARAAEAESRLRAATSSSTVQGESLKNERETIAGELEKAKLLAGERAKTIEDLRNQLESLRDRATEAENRLRVAQTKFSGSEADLREEKETLSRRIATEKSLREKAEEALSLSKEEIKIFQAKEEDAAGRYENSVDEMKIEIRSLKGDLLRKSQIIERLETKIQESTAGVEMFVPAAHEAEPEAPSSPEPEALSSPEPEAAPEPKPQPVAEPAPEPQPDRPDSSRTIPWKLAAAALAALLGAGGLWFFYSRTPPAASIPQTPPENAVLELSPEAEQRFAAPLEEIPETAPKAPPDRLPTVLKPEPKKKPRKRIKRVRRKSDAAKPAEIEAVPLPGYSGGE